MRTFGIELGIKLHRKRKEIGGCKWRVDSSYVRIKGYWCYLYRAIDKQVGLVDVYISEVRDQEAEENFFAQAENTNGITS